MATDLFKIYKLIAQRVRRDPYDHLKSEMKDLARDLVKRQPPRNEMIVIAEELCELEILIPNLRTLFSVRILRALRSGRYIVDVPPQVLHAWREKEGDEGYVYVATATTKPGLVKLGATSNTPEYRLDKYEHRYGYRVSVYWKTRTRMPFRLEKQVAKRIKGLRVSGLTYGDSNEWYRMSPKQLKEEIQVVCR